MPLHAGFAAALSIRQGAVQQVLHAQYVRNLIPARFQGTQNRKNTKADPDFTYRIAFDLFMGEPRVVAEPNPQDLVRVKLEFAGTLVFSAQGHPTVECEVHSRFTSGMEVKMIPDPNAGNARFALVPRLGEVTDAKTELVSGTDPKAAYDFSMGDLEGGLVLAMLAASSQFVFTPPMLDQLFTMGLALSGATTRITSGSINIGVDVVGAVATKGSQGALVDLNTASTPHGRHRVFSEAVHTADDEYGKPIHQPGWEPTTIPSPGPHGTEMAVTLNSVVLWKVFDRWGRYEVLRKFEDDKHAQAIGAIDSLQGKHAKAVNPLAFTRYQPSRTARTFIHELSLTLGAGFLQVEGEATHYEGVAITTGFRFKLGMVRTHVDGSTPFVMSNQAMDGMRGEVWDVEIDEPWWVTLAEILGAVVGVVAAPFTSGASLVLTMLLELVLSSVASSLLGNSENTLSGSLLDQVSGFGGDLEIPLPVGDAGPRMVLRPEDVVLAGSGVSSWFGLRTAPPAARIFINGHEGSTSWPAADSKPITVVFDDAEELFNPADTRVRIRWELFGESTANPILQRDELLNPAPGAGGGFQANPRRLRIDHAKDALDGYSSFVVKCRVYRPWGEWTEDLFKEELTIKITDLLNLKHPYVRWDHGVFYQGYSAPVGDPARKPTGWVSKPRHSKIHRTDPVKRCRFADHFSPDVAGSLVYLDQLPFDIAEIAAHRGKVCDYCFFGGPTRDKLK